MIDINLNNWRDSPNHVVLFFPPLAAGKFIMTCLSYHDLFVPWFDLKTNKSIPELLDTKNQFLEESIPTTVPNSWWSQERKGSRFWGFRLSYHQIFNWRISMSNNLIDKLLKPTSIDFLKKYKCFSVMHLNTGTGSPVSIDDIKSVLPNCKIIQIVNSNAFRKIAAKIKPHHIYTEIKDIIVEHPDVFYFNLDSIFNYNDFIQELNNALLFLGASSYSPEQLALVNTAYNRYMKLHTYD